LIFSVKKRNETTSDSGCKVYLEVPFSFSFIPFSFNSNLKQLVN